jgi:hypothetical protein
LEAAISREGIEGLSYWPTHFQHANNMAVVAGNEKSIPALKTNILWDMVDLIPYLVPTQFQESIPPPISVQKYGTMHTIYIIHTYSQYISFHIKACGGTGLHLADKDRFCKKKVQCALFNLVSCTGNPPAPPTISSSDNGRITSTGHGKYYSPILSLLNKLLQLHSQ